MTPDIAETTDLAACLALRRRVFIEEQGVPEAADLDGTDAGAIHLLARVGGRPVGTARLKIAGGAGKIGRVCVLPEFRGTGLGRALILAALDRLAAEPGVTTAKLSAQADAVGFYERLGFAAFGPVYLDAGIPHRDMARPLAP